MTKKKSAKRAGTRKSKGVPRRRTRSRRKPIMRHSKEG